MENNGISVSKAMIMAGYPETTARNPQQLTRSKGFLEIFDEAITEDDLVEAHKSGLNAYSNRPHLVDRDDKGRPVYDYVPEPDFHARHKYLETAYKLKGRLTGINSDTGTVLNVQLVIYGKDTPNTISVPSKTVSTSVSNSNGRRVQESGDSVAQTQREGQDSPPSSD